MINNIDDGTGTLNFQVDYPINVEVHDIINNIDDDTGKLDLEVKYPTTNFNGDTGNYIFR